MASGGVDSVIVLQRPPPVSPNTALSPHLSLRQTLQAGTGVSILNNFAENQGELSTFQRLKQMILPVSPPGSSRELSRISSSPTQALYQLWTVLSLGGWATGGEEVAFLKMKGNGDPLWAQPESLW